VDHAQQRPDREIATNLKPRVELLPCPAVHPDLAPLAAFPSPDAYRAASAATIALLASARSASPPAGPPPHSERGRGRDADDELARMLKALRIEPYTASTIVDRAALAHVSPHPLVGDGLRSGR